MTSAGRRALWVGAALLLLFLLEGSGEDARRGFTAAAADASLDMRIDLNGAGVAELESLPGIGPSLAVRIEEHRRRKGPFQRVDGLAAVPGIGAVKIRALAPFLTVGDFQRREGGTAQ
jgi:competence protein ComEA